MEDIRYTLAGGGEINLDDVSEDVNASFGASEDEEVFASEADDSAEDSLEEDDVFSEEDEQEDYEEDNSEDEYEEEDSAEDEELPIQEITDIPQRPVSEQNYSDKKNQFANAVKDFNDSDVKNIRKGNNTMKITPTKIMTISNELDAKKVDGMYLDVVTNEEKNVIEAWVYSDRLGIKILMFKEAYSETNYNAFREKAISEYNKYMTDYLLEYIS